MVGITGEARAAILAHAREAWPAECCGILVGREGLIARVEPARNLSHSPTTRFILDPADHIRIRRVARGTSEIVLGFYHSHPNGGPVPSSTDVDEASYPEAIYLIAGAGPSGRLSEIRAFRIAGGCVRDVVLGDV